MALVACGHEAPPPAPPPVPTVKATIVTYETTLMPEGKTVRFQVLSDGARVRSGDEADRWRLFDTVAGTITFVDEIARTKKPARFDDAVAERQRLLARALPAGTPRAIVREEDADPVDMREASKIVVEAGGYRREIVLSKETILPRKFLAMKSATDALAPERAGMLRDLLPVLLRNEGTMLRDRSAIVYVGGALSVETQLVSIREHALPASLFEVPADYALAEETVQTNP